MGLRQAGTWDPLLQCLHLDTPLCKQQNRKKQYGTENNYACAVGANSGQKIQRDQKSQLPLLKGWSKTRVLGAKAGYCACPLHTTPPKGRAEHLSCPSGLMPGHTLTLTPYKEPAREPVVCSCSPLLQQEPQ